MARQAGHFTLSEHSLQYLKDFPNKSKVVDEALELHRNKDKKIEKKENSTSEFQATEIIL